MLETISIMLMPIRFTHGTSSLLKNLWKCFRSKLSFWVCSFMTPRPPFFFESQTKSQAALGVFLLLRLEPLHKQCFLNLSICLITVMGKRKVNIKKVGRAVRTALVSCKCPASLRKEDISTILLYVSVIACLLNLFTSSVSENYDSC